MLNQTEKMVKAAVEFYISENPERARRIADDKGVDYDTCVKNFILKRFEEKEIREGQCCFKVKFNLEKIYPTIKDTAGFLQFLSEQLVKNSEPRLLTVLIPVPDLFTSYRDLILGILVFKTQDCQLIKDICQKSGIRPVEINDYFNTYWKKNNLCVSENIKFARKLIFCFDQDVLNFDSEITRWLRVDILKKYNLKAFQDGFKYAYLFENLDLLEKKSLIGTTINNLITEFKYVEAADLVTDFGGENDKLYFDTLQGVAAGLAYKRCFDGNQFKEAAEITLKYGIGDFRGAAQKELERMEKIDDRHFANNKYTMVEWAIKFGLKLRDNQLYRDSHYPEDLVKVGCMETARKRAIYLWNISLDPEILEKYFYPGTSYFSEEETIGYIVRRLLYNREFSHDFYRNLFIKEDYASSFLKPWDKQKVLDAFFIRWISWIGRTEFDDIEKLVGDIVAGSKDSVKINLKDLAVKAAQIALVEGRWDYYRRICKLWLPEQFEEIKKIDISKID